ncbi:hypothetical protein ALC57_06622 [Trachymyrmex cornetzi]|uniref:Uncharacterized protein n=1 Tax=Trachymyrmex cornetzi TaxID=471704 RepID=A0A195E6K0_9HYME|nr:hypothetical protein ALC57_06622 [Trachymyrmex cornetzi]
MRPSTRQVVNEAGDPDEEQEKQEHEVEHQQRVQPPPPPPPPPLPSYFITRLDVRRIPVCTSRAKSELRHRGDLRFQRGMPGRHRRRLSASTDKNAFPANTARSAQESRKPPSSSDTRDKERRPGAINQDGGREEDAIEGSVLPPPMSSLSVKKLRRRLDKRGLSRVSKEVSREISREKPKNRRVNTLVLTDIDFATAKTDDDEDDDFSEFEEEKDHRIYKEGILVSELPFKPKADIGNLDRVTAEEFCPLTLEDEASCEETTTWP